MRRRLFLAGLLAFVPAAGPASAWQNQTPTPPPPGSFTMELTSYPSRGKTIRAAVFRPVANARGSGVVILHGSGGMGPEQIGLAERFAADGYIAVLPTYLDAAEDDVVRPEPVMSAWRDCGADGIEYLISLGIDRRRTGITGYSLGSFIAVDGALGNSRAGAAIAIAGGWDVYIPRPPARSIPVLIIRAERDRVVSRASTDRWRRFLTDAEVPVRLQVIRGAGHLMSRAQWDEVYSRASTFFNGNIGRMDQ